MEMQQSQMKELEELSTCEISDALVKLGYKTGGHIPSMNLYSPLPHTDNRSAHEGSAGAGVGVRIVGPAFTVKLVRQEIDGEEVDEVKNPRAQKHFVDACPSGSVIFISSPLVNRAACWGGLMSTAAKAKGIKGAVIHGGCRDLAEHRALGFPVFAQFHSTLGQRTFLRPSQYDVPLSIPLSTVISTTDSDETTASQQVQALSGSGTASDNGETIVNPGDIIIADLDGVVVVPQGRVGEVIQVAKEGRDVDENVRKDLELGKGVKETMAKWRGK
ncbi:hypothetical protein IAU59_006491 [Kwoniella sp. CBS 9459]